MLENLLISTILQWILFLTIPLLAYVFNFRKRYNLLEFLGLKKPEKISANLFIKASAISLINKSFDIR